MPRSEDAVTDVALAVDPAVAQARRVVGLYGDPDVSWSIVLALGFAVPLELTAVQAAAAELVAGHPLLGRAAPVLTFTPDDEADLLGRFADAGYGDHDPLVRVALSADGLTLLVAAHHGAVDGLGLLGAAALLAGRELTSSARGIDPRDEPTDFLRATLGRLVEVAFHPPVRLRARPSDSGGDWLGARAVSAVRPSSPALLHAAATSVRTWNGGARARGRRLVVAMGLSRRAGSPTPSPDRDTAYVRLVADAVTSTSGAAALIARTPVEAAFPVTDGGGIAPKVARLLSGRLGSTLLVSNLGLVAGTDLRGVRFWPVSAGPAGTAIGLASAAGTTTVTVRQRRGWFTAAESARFNDLVASELEAAAQ